MFCQGNVRDVVLHVVAKVQVLVIVAVTDQVDCKHLMQEEDEAVLGVLEVVKQFSCSNWIAQVFFNNRGLFTMTLDFPPASFTIFNTVAGAKKCSFAKECTDFVESFFSDL